MHMRRPIIRRAPARESHSANKRPTRRFSLRRLDQAIKIPKTPYSTPPVMQKLWMGAPEAIRHHFKLPKLSLPSFKRNQRFKPKEEIIQSTFFIVSPLPSLIFGFVVGILTWFIDSKDALDPNDIEKNKKAIREELAGQTKNLIRLLRASGKDPDEISSDISGAILCFKGPGMEEGGRAFKAANLLQDMLTDALSNKSLSVDAICEKVLDGVCLTFKKDPKSFTDLSRSDFNVAVNYIAETSLKLLRSDPAKPMSQPMSTENILQALTHVSDVDSFTQRIAEFRSGATTSFKFDYHARKGERLFGQGHLDFLFYEHALHYRYLYNRNNAERKPLQIGFLDSDAQNETTNKR